jgi:hypothetical protein
MGLISGEKLVDSKRGSGHRYYQKLSSFPDNPFKKSPMPPPPMEISQ